MITTYLKRNNDDNKNSNRIAELSVGHRTEWLLQAADRLRARREELAHLMTAEMGKTWLVERLRHECLDRSLPVALIDFDVGKWRIL